MIQKVLVTPIIGLPQINGWVQVTQSPDGKFITVFSIQGSQAGNVGRDLVDLIKSNSPETATSVYSLMKKIIRFVTEKDCQIEISASYLSDGRTIFAAYNGSLLLKRNGKVGSLLKADQEVKIIEGIKTPEDIFVLLTNSSLGFKGEIFQKLSQGLDADTTVASIVPGVQNLEDSSLVGMAFLSDLPNGYVGDTIVDDLLSTDSKESVLEIQDDGLGGEEGHDQLNSDKEPFFEAVSGKKRFRFDKDKIINLLKVFWRYLRKILFFILVILKKIFRFFRQLFTNEVYVDEKVRLAKKRMRIIVLVILGLFLILVPILLFQFSVKAQVKEATQAINQSLADFETAKQNTEEDPIQTRETIAGVMDSLFAQEKAFSNKKAGQKYISEQLSIVQEYFDSISGKEVFNELSVFYDFQLVESDFIATHVKVSDNGKAYFFDKDKKQIVELELGNKKVRTVQVGEGNFVDFSINDDSFYFLGEGIFEQKIGSDQINKIIDSGKSNQSAKLISNFNSNLYVLNPEQRNVYKYSYSESDYSDPIRWVKSAKGLEFDQVISMVVDGDIWLSLRDGKIFKLSAGNGNLFEINGLSEPLTSQTYLFTQPDYENIYLLEPSSSRFIVVNKNGDFVKEVKSISLASTSGLAVNEEIGKAVVISGSLVFEVGL
jgi:hypothetical protein